MKNPKIRIICIFLILSTIISLFTGCAEKTKASLIKTKAFSDLKIGESGLTDGFITENERFTMSWNGKYNQVVINDSKTNTVYSTIPTNAMQVRYDSDGFEIMNNIMIESPIIVYYYNPETMSENQAYASTDSITDGKFFSEKITDGIRITYVFSAQEISVSVDYVLKQDSFYISIDPTKISDNGEFIVTGVSVAPFLCSLNNSTKDSYLFIPDGSGAIIKPESIDHIGRQGSKRIYGEDITVNDFTLTSYEKNINMPVFGKKDGDKGVLGIITSSAENAYINWDVGSNAKGYSSVYPFFRIRGYDIIKRPAGFMMSLSEIPVFDDYIKTSPLTVEYFPLDKENASYTGMAKTYRQYLIDNGLSEKNDADYEAVFRILGATEQKVYNFGVPSTKIAPLTTITQAQEILKFFNGKIDGKLMTQLVGFGQSGLDLGKVGGGFKIAAELGNKKNISSLKSFCNKNNIAIYMDFDILGFKDSGNGFSKSDAAKAFDGQTVYLDFYSNITRNEDGGKRYMLLSRNRLTDAAEKAKMAIKDYGFDGMVLGSLSDTAYSDFGSVGCGLSGKISEDVTKIFESVSKDASVLSRNSNVYAAAFSDFITEAPDMSSQYDISLYDIPFYQIVFKGYIPMSSTSINLSVDSNTAVLKCIEAGIIPTFTLCYEYDSSFIQSKFSAVNVSSYKGLKEEIIGTVKKISAVNEMIGDSAIANHFVLENGLRITEFENGVSVAVNYGKKALMYGDRTVDNNDYIIWEE